LFLASKTDTVHVIDIDKHQGTAEDVRGRMRKLELRELRRERKRAVTYPEQVHLGE
jgi:hypothetical protein